MKNKVFMEQAIELSKRYLGTYTREQEAFLFASIPDEDKTSGEGMQSLIMATASEATMINATVNLITELEKRLGPIYLLAVTSFCRELINEKTDGMFKEVLAKLTKEGGCNSCPKKDCKDRS